MYLFGKLVGIMYNNTRYNFVRNIQGDIIKILSSTGLLQAEYIYDAWGNHQVLGHNGLPNSTSTFIGNINPFRYRGYYYDVETGLYYLNARYYDPQTGRFISADTLSVLDETMSEINGLNLYAYCGNNPVMYIDSTGHFVISFLAGLLIASLTFTVVNTGTQLVGDLINYVVTGKWESSWEEYVGAFVGGFAGGATFFLTSGNLMATFAVMGGVSKLCPQV